RAIVKCICGGHLSLPRRAVSRRINRSDTYNQEGSRAVSSSVKNLLGPGDFAVVPEAWIVEAAGEDNTLITSPASNGYQTLFRISNDETRVASSVQRQPRQTVGEN